MKTNLQWQHYLHCQIACVFQYEYLNYYPTNPLAFASSADCRRSFKFRIPHSSPTPREAAQEKKVLTSVTATN